MARKKVNIGDVAGAAAGSVVPLVGPALVSAASNIVENLFGGGVARDWRSAGPGVHDWFTKYGHQAFLDWMRANHPDKFTNLDTVKALAYTWADGGEAFLHTNDPNYWIGRSRDKTNKFFADMGIDLPAAQAHNRARGGDGDRISTTLDAIPIAPSAKVVDEIQRVEDKKAAGQKLSPSEEETHRAITKSIAKSDFGLGSLLPLLLLVILAYLVIR